MSELKGRRVGRVLTKMGRVSREQVHQALAKQLAGRKEGKRTLLGEIMVELGLVTPLDVNEALAGQKGMEWVDLDDYEVTPDLLEAVPASTAMAYQVMPISFDASSKKLTIAMTTADNFRAVDDLQLLMGFKVTACVADEEQVVRCLKEHYSGSQESVSNLVEEIASDEKLALLDGRGESIDLDAVLEAAADNKVVHLLNLVLMQAIRDKASDIHFEPFEDEFKMRYRIDGVLYEMVPPPKYLATPIASRIKVMANLDIAERRLPQDGRIELVVSGNPVDLRVSVLPTMYGESVVLRVLDRSNTKLSLDAVGFREDDLETVEELIRKPNGIIIVTGPTGSGKTTTLYAALNELNKIETKILTAEDPVEYDIDGLCQCQINTDVGMTFARCLRSFLRQDPDIILVGEIRDIETAQIAVQASLTGHLVFSTLHTNDAPSSIIRLVDLGMEPFLLTATIEAIIAQRLVRLICTKCKEQFVPSESQLMEVDLRPEDVEGRTFFRGRGCEACNKSSYRGRMALFEILKMDDEIRELVMHNASTQVIRMEAKKRGMRSLRETGLLSIFEGQTTIDEVVRETIVEE
ncbi:MAG: Flp pilus assembly complex ATPase component TadA [Phycisphaerales bacterium]|nr:Flp pilus assembly complex ATPase component TadA [Phycisphaerales bacterium]